MTKTIKARFSHGVIEPLEKLEFPDGKMITVTISDSEFNQTKDDKDPLDSSFGSWAVMVDCEKLKKDIYDDRQISTRPEVKL